MGVRPAPLLSRPRTRGECAGVPRPCQFRSCRFHLRHVGDHEHGNQHRAGPITTDSCALDVADRGAVTLQEVGDALSITRERVRQLENKALAKFRRAALRLGCLDEMDEWLEHVVATHWHSGLGDLID